MDNFRQARQDLLESYYTLDFQTHWDAKEANVPLSQFIELKAYTESDTIEGINLYNSLLNRFKSILGE